MSILIYGGLILSGFVLGYFFQTGVLIILSVIIIIIAILWLSKAQEIETLLAMGFAACGGVSILAMWVTWYFVNDKTFVQDFFKHYILK